MNRTVKCTKKVYNLNYQKNVDNSSLVLLVCSCMGWDGWMVGLGVVQMELHAGDAHHLNLCELSEGECNCILTKRERVGIFIAFSG